MVAVHLGSVRVEVVAFDRLSKFAFLSPGFLLKKKNNFIVKKDVTYLKTQSVIRSAIKIVNINVNVWLHVNAANNELHQESIFKVNLISHIASVGMYLYAYLAFYESLIVRSYSVKCFAMHIMIPCKCFLWSN